MTDALSDIVSRARIMGRIDFQATLTTECGVRFPATGDKARYHMITGGECWAMIDDTPTPLQLNGVGLLIIPRGAAHSIAGSIDAPVQDIALNGAQLETTIENAARRPANRTGPDMAFLVSGVFEMDPEFGDILVNELPDYLHLPLGEREDLGWLRDAVRFVAHEVAEDAPGAGAIAHRMGEIIFMETIKSFAETAAAGVIACLRDPNIGAALTAFHQAPGTGWTVAKLAKEAGLSRSVFAERASRLLGMTPMQYLKDWRLMLARRLLLETERRIEEIAAEVGYASTDAFVKAYRNYYGAEPRGDAGDAHGRSN